MKKVGKFTFLTFDLFDIWGPQPQKVSRPFGEILGIQKVKNVNLPTFFILVTGVPLA